MVLTPYPHLDAHSFSPDRLLRLCYNVHLNIQYLVINLQMLCEKYFLNASLIAELSHGLQSIIVRDNPVTTFTHTLDNHIQTTAIKP